MRIVSTGNTVKFDSGFRLHQHFDITRLNVVLNEFSIGLLEFRIVYDGKFILDQKTVRCRNHKVESRDKQLLGNATETRECRQIRLWLLTLHPLLVLQDLNDLSCFVNHDYLVTIKLGHGHLDSDPLVHGQEELRSLDVPVVRFSVKVESRVVPARGMEHKNTVKPDKVAIFGSSIRALGKALASLLQEGH